MNDDNDNKMLKLSHTIGAESRYQFVRHGSADNLAIVFDFKFDGSTDINRGITFGGTSAIGSNMGLYGIPLQLTNENGFYELVLKSSHRYAVDSDTWYNIRIEVDSLYNKSACRYYINNALFVEDTIASSLVGFKAYEMLVYANYSGQLGFTGNVYIDNLYVGDLPETVKHGGFDTLTPIAYDYTSRNLIDLNTESIVTRKPDGSILVKEAPEHDLDATSKKYVDGIITPLLERIAALEEQLANFQPSDTALFDATLAAQEALEGGE